MPRGIPGSGPDRKPARRRKARLDGVNLNMSVPEISDHTTRWVNDLKNRPHKLNTMDDWDFVRPDEITDPETGKPLVGEATKNPNVDGGGRVRMRVGVQEGEVIYAYLMKKRTEFVEADLAEKHKAQVEDDDRIRRGISHVDHQYGDVQLSR